jgi:tape measure domain-containing protein
MSISTTFTLRFSGADVQRGLVMITRQINSLGRAASGLGKSLVTPFAGLTAMLAPAAIGAGFLSMIKNASDTASRFEQMTLKFKMFTGSLEGAKKVMQGLRDIDMVSNLDIESLGNAQAKLMAYGFTAEDALKSVERLSKVSGGNADVFSSLALAFGQTKSAMKLKGDDLRQYTERGWNPLQQIMAATGETFAEVSKRMKLGKIGFEEVNWALRSITEGTGKFAKAHDLGSKTFLAATSRMKTQYMLLQNEFGKPFNVSLGEIFDRIAAKIPLMNEEARKLG